LRQGFFAGEVFESGHQRPLNGQSVGLDLPSGEVVAIVSKREFEISWQISNLMFQAFGKRTVMYFFRPNTF
jgi:hypothetical protein